MEVKSVQKRMGKFLEEPTEHGNICEEWRLLNGSETREEEPETVSVEPSEQGYLSVNYKLLNGYQVGAE